MTKRESYMRILSTHTPLDVLRIEYAEALYGKSIPIGDTSERMVSNENLAAFMVSELRRAIDRENAYKRLMLHQG